MMTIKKLSSVLVATLLASGCSIISDEKEGSDRVRSASDRVISHLNKHTTGYNGGPVYQELPFAILSSGDVREISDMDSPLLDLRGNYASGIPKDIQQISKELQQQWGINFHLAKDAIDANAAAGVGISGGEEEGPTAQRVDGIGQLVKNATSFGEDYQANIAQRNSGLESITFVTSGTRREILDNLTTRLGLSWRYVGGKIEIFRYETATFYAHLPLQKGTGSAKAGGGEGAAGANVEVGFSLDSWEKLVEQLRALSSEKASFATNNVSGSVTVRDFAENISLMRQVYEDEMAVARKQVAMEVIEISVKTTEDSAFAWSPELLLNSEGLSTAIKGAAASVATGSGLSIQATSLKGTTEGTIASLSKRDGEDERITMRRTVVMTKNNTPVTATDVLMREVVTNIDIEESDSGDESVEFEKKTYWEGMALSVLPRIDKHNNVTTLLSLNVRTFDPDEIQQFGNSSVTNVKYSDRETMQIVTVPDGEAIAVWGFEREYDANTNNGVGNPDFKLFGGANTSEKTIENLIYIIRPVVQDYATGISTVFGAR